MSETREAPYRGVHPEAALVIVTTGPDLAGHEITEYLGIVRGIVVRAQSIGQGIVGAFKGLGGGNIKEYVDVCDQARQDAYLLMMKHARDIGAEAVIGMRYDATEFAQGVTEVLAYGTAVKLAR